VSRGRSSLLLLLLALLVAPPLAQADDGAEPARTETVRHRSVWESVAALPGQLLFLPVRVVLGGGKFIAYSVWEMHLLDRAAAALTTSDGRTGLRPLSNTNLGTGVRVFHRPSPYQLELLSTFGRDPENRRHHMARVDRMTTDGRLSLRAHLRYEPDENFYGVGMDSPRAGRTRYGWQETAVQVSWQPRPGRHLALDTRVGWRHVDIGSPRDAEVPETVSFYGNSELAGLGTARNVDVTASLRSRFVDIPGSPRNGNLSVVQVGVHPDVAGDGLSYLSLHAVTEQFHELFYGRALSWRTGVDWRVPIGSDEVPFYNLASVGGNLFVRGYQGGRFRDRGALFSSLRYKFPIWKLLDGTLFYEAGRTFPGVAKLSLNDWRRSWGGGIRLWVRSGVIFDQWVAFSDEEWRLLFSFTTDF